VENTDIAQYSHPSVTFGDSSPTGEPLERKLQFIIVIATAFQTIQLTLYINYVTILSRIEQNASKYCFDLHSTSGYNRHCLYGSLMHIPVSMRGRAQMMCAPVRI
jgi:hypothetical protein